MNCKIYILMITIPSNINRHETLVLSTVCVTEPLDFDLPAENYISAQDDSYSMAVDNYCKNQIITIIKSELNKIPFDILKGIAKVKAENKLNEFINSIPNTEFNLTLSDYLTRHPEVKSKYPDAFRLLPQCTYNYTMQELIECLHEIKGYI